MSFKKLKVRPPKDYRKQKFWHLKSKKITGQKKKKKDFEEKIAEGANFGNKSEVGACREFVGQLQHKNNCTVRLKFPLT